MGEPLRNSSAGGFPVVIPTSIVSATVTRITSTQFVLRSTGWIRADLLPSDDWVPERHESPFHWRLFPDWHEDAKCRSLTPRESDDIFFGEGDNDHRTTMTVSKLRKVKEFCMSCPVWETCLRHALTSPERHGVWAGTSKRTRLRILTKIEQGTTTVDQVIDDYQNGRERKYESIRHQG
jgi:WhiB family redox-sensing transcriptional regulator